MIIDMPQNTSQLRDLWKQAFGDTDAFLDCFFEIAYSPNRCRCVYQGDTLAAMLYWFDCSWEGRKLAYLYAVATEKTMQGRGFCRLLLEDTHRHLQALGYAGSILVPRTEDLFAMYEKLGYTTCSYVRNFHCEAGTPIPLEQIGVTEYAQLRRQYLPDNAVVQEGETLALLQTYSAFYTGENLLIAMYVDDGKCTVCELLGASEAAPSIIAALGYTAAKLRTPGQGTPFAMYHSFTEGSSAPGYFGLALD